MNILSEAKNILIGVPIEPYIMTKGEAILPYRRTASRMGLHSSVARPVVASASAVQQVLRETRSGEEGRVSGRITSAEMMAHEPA